MLKIPTTRLLLVTIFAIAIGSASPSRLRADSKPAVGKKTLLFYYLCDQKKFHWTWEDIYRPGRRDFSYGMGSMRVIPPPANAAIGQIVRFLQPQLPNVKIWQDAVNKSVVHLANRRVLHWSKYPLNKKLTFHGTMSFLELEKRVLKFLIPSTHFIYSVYQPGTYGGDGVASDVTPLEVATRFNVKGDSLRRFLTTGMRYHGGNAGDLELWQADVYVTGNRKYTGRVDINLCATPQFVPATAQPKKDNK